ncbi:A disintegrin and metalloproteinase with thrombospondin motifs like [Mytilus trossulus]|uniref:A disintegrin and metalloproteinase with thrombospondin motifs like n=1 Tax=Mytilus trossulus TaxID=6551 RepID=UPI00300732C1
MGSYYVLKCLIFSLVQISFAQWDFTNNLKEISQLWEPFVSGISPHEDLPVDFNITGDPTQDPFIDLHLLTVDRIYKMQLQRLEHNILHEDVRLLTVSVDSSGRTVFKEQLKPVDIFSKAKEMNFYHDINTGTLINVKARRKGTADKPFTFIEGVMFDELMVASPLAQKRHKRSIHRQKHILYKKSEMNNEMFHFDTMKVPEHIDKLQEPQNSQNITYRTRRKRQAGTPKIEPELLLFVDYALFKDFGGDSNELLEYLLHFWHSVNWKYLTIALSGKWPIIDIKIREIGVFKEPNAQPFIESSRMTPGSKLFSLYDAMDTLQKWLVKYENALPLHDIAFLQTGENACRKTQHTDPIAPWAPSILSALRHRLPLKTIESMDDDECVKGTAGVAYVRGACLSAPFLRGNAFNFGIGEASTSFNGIIIAAHEVGHLLGAYHDGEAEARSCSTQSGYIMSYTRDDSFKFSRFSSCSIKSFQNFLRMERAKCLLQRYSRESLEFPTTFPGKFMNLNEQCRRFTGGPPCEEGPTQCEHLCCDDRNGEWRYTRSEPAVDGTTCGSSRVCLNGQCVPLSTIGRK